MWLYWTLDQEGLIYQSEPIRLQTDRQLQALPILRLPAACSAYENLVELKVNLNGKAVGQGSIPSAWMRSFCWVRMVFAIIKPWKAD